MRETVAAEWGWNPDTVVAVTGLLTLLAAFAAAAFARGAWRAADRQADAADQQLALAEEQLQLARHQAAEFGRQLTDQAAKDAALRRRELEAKADERAPEVLLRFERFFPLQRRLENNDIGEIEGPVTLAKGHNRVLFVGAELLIKNVSTHTAEVWLQSAGEEVTDRETGRSVGGGRAVVLSPGEERIWDWQREVFTGLFRLEDVPTPAHAYESRLRVWVRDLGLNVRDEYELAWSWNHVSTDGTYLKIDPAPPGLPAQPAAFVTGRLYERLDHEATSDPDRP